MINWKRIFEPDNSTKHVAAIDNRTVVIYQLNHWWTFDLYIDDLCFQPKVKGRIQKWDSLAIAKKFAKKVLKEQCPS